MAAAVANAEIARERSSVKSRAYQMEMVEESLKRNVIVAMDTGSGKTHVAVIRIKKELEVIEPGKIIWFLVPTVQLCLQQLTVLQSQIASVQIKSLTSLDNVDKWSNKATWDTVLTNVSIVVSTYAVLCDALFHAFVRIESLALIVFDEAHNCIGKSPAAKLMKGYYWPSKNAGETVPHILGLTASPIMGSNSDDLENLESILDAKCKSPRYQKMDLALHVKLPTSLQIHYDTAAGLRTQTPAMRKLRTVHANINIHEDPEIIRLRNTNTQVAEFKLRKALMGNNTFAQKQIKSFIRTSISIYDALGEWAVDAYISQVVSAFLQCTDSKNEKFLGWEESEKQYLANSLRCLDSASDTVFTSSKAFVSDKARALIQFLSAYKENTIGIIFAKERSIAYMLHRLLSEHPDIGNMFRLGMIVGMSKRQVGRHDICEFSHDETQTKTLKRFRTGEINLLIATSVVEEGIDVPQCNLVLCFDEPSNLKSFIQRRGRARLRESKLVIMLEKTSQSCIARWEELEHQMKLQYEEEERSAQVLAQLEETEMEKMKHRRFKVESTGAILDMDTAKGHLECFCSRLSSSSKAQLKPEYIIVEMQNESMQSEPPLLKAKVILPVTLDPKFRVYESRALWRSEKNATKDAAFEAYVALYHAELVNDHLLPFDFTDQLDVIEEIDSLIDIEQQFNPWPAVAQSWENEETLQRRVLTVKDEAGSKMCLMQMLIPANFPNMKPIRLHFNSSSEWKIEVGPATITPHLLSTEVADDTTALLTLSHGHRWDVEQLRHIVLFKAIDMDLNSFAGKNPSSISIHCIDDTIGLLRDPQNRGHPYLFHKWLSAKPSLESIEKPHKDYDSFPQDQPYVAVKKWSQRSDFLHPIAPNIAIKKSSKEYFRVFPESALKMDTLPTIISQFGLFIPSILHTVEIQLVVRELCTSILIEIENLEPELIQTAISAPVSSEQENYQKLELLGDSVLKLFTSVFAASRYPHYPEGYLSNMKATFVSNKRLCRAGCDRKLGKFILTETFTGKKWRPIYVETQLGEQEKTTRRISAKIMADVVESLIGAGWKMGNSTTSLAVTKVFLPELDLPSLEVGRRRLFDIAEANIPLPAHLFNLEKLVGYTFKKKSLLIQSMSHSSCRFVTNSYDRLEFLGDAVLDMIIVDELMKYEEELSHSLIHLYKTCLVNGDYLAFIALEWKITEKRMNLKEDPRSGELVAEESVFTLPLWRFMSQELFAIGEAQCEVELQHVLLRRDIINALESGKEYPWALLASINANKFYSDLVESLLGAVWVDSGSFDTCRQVLDRMGILKLVHRLVKDKVHAIQPIDELYILAKGKQVDIDSRIQRNPDTGNEWRCTVSLEENKIVEKVGGKSKNEIEIRAAEAAVTLLRSANGGSGLPVAYGRRRTY